MHNSPLLTAEELAALRNLPPVSEEALLPLPATLAHDQDYDDSTMPAGHLLPDPVGYWRRQAEVEASNARDARMHVRQLRKAMAKEEWRAFQFGWGLVLTWCVIIAMAWMGVV